MNLLAIDTSLLACSAGVQAGNRVVERYAEQPREHTRLLVPMIRQCLQEIGLTFTDLDAVVLGNGPGSFIGLRIAASVAQGLAFAAGLRIFPVSSLAAVACANAEPGETVAVAQDAHMQEVYLGLYRLDAKRLPQPLIPERLQAQAAIAELAEYEPVVAAGFGWQRYGALFEANRSAVGRVATSHYPTAASLLAVAAGSWSGGDLVHPADIEPAYLRQRVAQAAKRT